MLQAAESGSLSAFVDRASRLPEREEESNMTNFRLNWKLATRGLLRSPGFTFAAVTTLAVGIGLNSAMLAVFDQLLLRPLPFDGLDSLVAVYDADPKTGWTTNALNGANFLEYKQRSTCFEAAAVYQDATLTLSGDGEPQRIVATRVGYEFFPILRIRPRLGRVLAAADDEPDGPKVAIIDHALWRDQFGGDPSVLGRSIRLDGQLHEVVGVLPSGLKFGGLLTGRVFLPLRLGTLASNSRSGHNYMAFARLRRGRSAAEADQELKMIAGQLAAAYPATSAPGTGSGSATVLPLLEVVRSENSTYAVTLVCLSVFLLLIACANVANLILARGLARQHELAIRSALGAGRGALVGGMLTECAILGLVGAAAGLGIGKALLVAIRILFPALPELERVGIDAWSLAYIAGTAVLAIGLSGLVPAWNLSRVEPIEAIKKRQRGTSEPRQRRFQFALLATQIALSMVLLTGSGLMLRTLWTLGQVEVGIQPDGLVTGKITLPQSKYATTDASYAFVQRLQNRMAALPGIRGACVTNVAPVEGWPSGLGNTMMWIVGRALQPGIQNLTYANVVTPEYFKTAGVPLLQGEVPSNPTPEDCLVNERFVKIHDLGTEAVGKHIQARGPNGTSFLLKIVGVVGNVRFRGLAGEIVPQTYTFPVQGTKMTHRNGGGDFCIYLKSEGNPHGHAAAMKSALRELDPDLALYNVRTVDEIVRVSLEDRSTMTALFILFGSLGLLLAAVGLYGLMAYLVAQRRRDIGIRMSLGCTQGRIVREILRHGLVSTGVGLGLGGLVSLATGRFLASQLFRVSPQDTIALGISALLLIVVSASACLIPAVRAARIDPVVALRDE
jgi:predicted permease